MSELDWKDGRSHFERDLKNRFYTFISYELWDCSDEEKLKKAEEGDMWKVVRFRCVKCGKPHNLKCCRSCGRGFYKSGISQVGTASLSCKNCGFGIMDWNCPSCGAKNQISKSIEYLCKKESCFIATAVYESYEAPEVIILRKFRDDILNLSKLGQYFIKFYYFFSPPLAKFLSKKSKLKIIVREKILTPFVRYIEKKLIK